MSEWKVLADNSHIRAKLGVGYVDSQARSVEAFEGDEAAGRRKMMLDMGLTASELSAGLAGTDVTSWMTARAKESGMVWPDGNPRFHRELSHVLQENARAHNVGLSEYMVLEPYLVRASMGALYGSNMTGEAYLLKGIEHDPMDWSGRTQDDVSAMRPRAMFAGKTLSPNAPSDDLFTTAVPEISWEDLEQVSTHDGRTVGEVGIESLPMPDLSGIPEIHV